MRKGGPSRGPRSKNGCLLPRASVSSSAKGDNNNSDLPYRIIIELITCINHLEECPTCYKLYIIAAGFITSATVNSENRVVPVRHQ